MALSPGTRLGSYEIISAVGAGGMGEVYRARDPRLGRDVAIKILPDVFADDPDRRARFEREAQAVAALSHPNIVAIFDTGSQAPTGSGPALAFVVMELLDGETLRERLAPAAAATRESASRGAAASGGGAPRAVINAGALPVRKAVEIAIQIARGLGAAHVRGLVHRDLKPENVFLLGDGQVKILDFGLARQATGDGSGAAQTVAATDPGIVMGTVGYMAPEQVRGQAVDARTDLFAFGAVLYEMLTGQRAFHRDTAAETMTAILREDPADLSSARADLSPALDRIVRHCLEKNPAERFQTARDVAFALEAFPGTSVSSSAVAALPPVRRSWRGRAIVTAVGLLGLTAGYALKSSLATAPASAISFETRTWDPQWITNVRFGQDGQTLVYSAAASGNVPDLFVMRQGAVVAQRLGQPATHLLSVSKNGELAVLTGVSYLGHRLFKGTLTRMTMDGAARPWMEQVREADWSPDGSTLAIVRDLGTKDQIEYPIGTRLHESSNYLSDPRVSPEGSRVAFIEHSASRYDDRGSVKVVDQSGAVRTLAGEFWGVEGLAWSPDGRTVVFSSSGGSRLFPHMVNVDGAPVVRPAFPSMASAETMDIAADGRLLMNAAESRISMRALLPGQSVEREFPWLDLPLPVDQSADGQWLLFTDESQSAGADYAVALRKTDGTPAVRLGVGNAVALSPDASWALAYIPSARPRRYVLYPTGPGQAVPLDFSPIVEVASVDWFPDGRLLACGTEASKPSRCYRKDLKGGTTVPVTPEGTIEGWAAPDGQTVIGAMADGSWRLMNLAGAEPRAIAGHQQTDQMLGWSADSRAVFVRPAFGVPGAIERLDLTTGARVKVREQMPPDRAGVIAIISGRVRNDGQAYSYSYWRQVTNAIVVTGIPLGR